MIEVRPTCRAGHGFVPTTHRYRILHNSETRAITSISDRFKPWQDSHCTINTASYRRVQQMARHLALKYGYKSPHKIMLVFTGRTEMPGSLANPTIGLLLCIRPNLLFRNSQSLMLLQTITTQNQTRRINRERKAKIFYRSSTRPSECAVISSNY